MMTESERLRSRKVGQLNDILDDWWGASDLIERGLILECLIHVLSHDQTACQLLNDVVSADRAEYERDIEID
jgi:hypothetical protein